MPTATVGAKEAAKILGIKLQTLYAYASRGLLRRSAAGTSRARLYLRVDVERLKARHESRRGHTAVAASALRWGEPVLDSALTEVTPQGPSYRGQLAVSFVERGARFEEVAEILWGDATGEAWPRPSADAASQLARRWVPVAESQLSAMLLLIAALRARDEDRLGTRHDTARAKLLIRACAALPFAPNMRSSRETSWVAEDLCVAFGIAATPERRRALDAALVLTADHELSASAFTARVVASTGADLYACVAAALMSFSGPLHGGECDRVEALVRDVSTASHVKAELRARMQRGEAIVGFGHRLYPHGDPRAIPLLALAKRHASSRSPAHRVLNVVTAMKQLGGEPPTVDVGLVALAASLGLPPGAATAIFAIGRMAGLVAHVLEQRQSGVLLRPRARYVAPG